MPRLIHPIPVFLRQIDRDETALYDDNLHEPIGQSRRERKPVRLLAQVQIGNTDSPVASEGGVVEESDGYLLFRTLDLRTAQVTLDRGDRIVQIGEEDNAREVDLYITRFKQMGHYPRAKGHTLLRAYFQDRKPSRQRGDL